MARSDLKKRIEALEGQARGGKAWHVIIHRAHQTEAEAVAAYEAENGPIDPERSVLRVIVRKPAAAND